MHTYLLYVMTYQCLLIFGYDSVENVEQEGVLDLWPAVEKGHLEGLGDFGVHVEPHQSGVA